MESLAFLMQGFGTALDPMNLAFAAIGVLLGTAVGGYVRGQLVIATFIGVFVWLGLTIIGIPSAAAIGLLFESFLILTDRTGPHYMDEAVV